MCQNIGVGQFDVKILPLLLTFYQLDYIYYMNYIEYSSLVAHNNLLITDNEYGTTEEKTLQKRRVGRDT